MKKIILTICLVLFSLLLVSQSLVFDKAYDFNYYDRFNDFVQTEDNGFMLVGETRVPNDIQNILLVKTDAGGELIWSKTFGGNLVNNANRIIPSNDGNFYVAGRFMNQAYVLKVNSDGDSLTSLIFESEYGSKCMDLAELENGNLLILQQIFLLPSSTDIILSDPEGDPVWTIDAAANESGNIYLIDDETFYVTGFNGLVMYPHAIVASYDMQGNLLFSNEYSDIEGVYTCSVLSPSYDIYLGGHHLFQYHSSPSIIKTDPQGNFEWEEAYFDITVGGVSSMAFWGEDYLISTGTTNADAFVLKTNLQGDSLKALIFNDYDEQEFNQIMVADNHLLLAGYYFDWGEGSNARFMKLNLDTLATSVYEINNAEHPDIHFYPNPATEKVYISIKNLPDYGSADFRIIGTDGRIHYHKNNIPPLSVHHITDLDSGVYIGQLILDGKPVESRKLLIGY